MKIKNLLIVLIASFLAIGCGGGGGGVSSDPLNFNQAPKNVVKVDKLATIDENNYEKVIMLALDDSLVNELNEQNIFAGNPKSSKQRRAKIVDGSSDSCFSGKAEYDDVNYVVRFTNCDQDDKVIDGLLKYNDSPEYATSQQIKNFSIKFKHDDTLKEFYIQEGYISENSFKITGYIKTKNETLKFKDLELREGTNSFEENGYISSKKYLNGEWVKLITTKAIQINNNAECYSDGEFLIIGDNSSKLKVNFDNCKIKITMNGTTKTYKNIDDLKLSTDNPGADEPIETGELYNAVDNNDSLNKAYYSALIETKNSSLLAVALMNKLKELKNNNCNSGSVEYNGNIATYNNCEYDGYTFTGKSLIKKISDYSDEGEFEAYVKNLHIKKDNSEIYFKDLHLKYYADTENSYELTMSGYISNGIDKISFLNLKYNYDPAESGTLINGSISSDICLSSKWIEIKTNNFDPDIDKGELEITLGNENSSIYFNDNIDLIVKINNTQIRIYNIYDDFINEIKATCED